MKAVSHHKTSEGVPLDCDGEIIFGNDSSDPFCKQIFKFDCSFLLPIRQTYEISLTNNKGYCDKVIKGNHFVLPRCPSESKFEIESSFVGYGDNATRNLNNIECISETLSISQEVEMFNTFSDKILTNDENETLYWKRISLLTQVIVDACYKSLNLNGESVSVNYELLQGIKI